MTKLGKRNLTNKAMAVLSKYKSAFRRNAVIMVVMVHKIVVFKMLNKVWWCEHCKKMKLSIKLETMRMRIHQESGSSLPRWPPWTPQLWSEFKSRSNLKFIMKNLLPEDYLFIFHVPFILFKVNQVFIKEWININYFF